MMWRVEVKEKDAALAASVARAVLADIQDLRVGRVKNVRITHVYLLTGRIDAAQVETIARELLTDPIVQEYRIYDRAYRLPQTGTCRTVEIAYHAGVADPVETSTLKGIRDLGIDGVEGVRTARQYAISGTLSDEQLKIVTQRVLMNKLIQHAVSDCSPISAPSLQGLTEPKFDLIQVDLLKASSSQLLNISRQGQLYLNLGEMKAVQDYFRRQARNPTDAELETIAQTWSEHCRHKTFRGNIRYRQGRGGRPQIIRSLFKTCIAQVTAKLNKDWCVSVFHDNAGVIAFDADHHVCFKVETHNHPSALEPFGGANTGVGGVIRDILGTGLGAKPLCNTDVFCFAPPGTPEASLPKGALHPKRVMKGVISGVRDYGNKMGIPTVNGAIVFDPAFAGNPLVFCGNVGLLPRGKENKKVQEGDLIVAVGGRTGRDGIHGATFSSGELTTESETISSGAVQIGNPIVEKKVLDALLVCRDLGLYSAITDCGAGGFSSAVGEMGETTGAKVHLDKVPLKYQGLKYHEIWISESQERMVLAVPPKHVQRLQEIFRREDVEAVVIGTFEGKRLQLFYHDIQVAELELSFLHGGLPMTTKEAVYTAPLLKKPRLPAKPDLENSLKLVISHANVASKESIIRVYDHEVQGTSVIKPLVGLDTDGPSDAAVLRPRLGSQRGVAVANGINVRFGKLDPYWMAAGCVDEAIRQLVCVGTDPERIALLDNFCWGNPDKPDRLGALVRCAQGCRDAALKFGTPYISGKDSLYNEYTQGKKSLAIPGTILISSIGIIEDVRACVTMDFKEAGNSIYLIGQTFDELGGAIYLEQLGGQLGHRVPIVRFKPSLKRYHAIFQAVQSGWVQSLHDCSEGGLAVALTEMAFAGAFGAAIDLNRVPGAAKLGRDDVVLFSESHSRVLAEVAPRHEKQFEQKFKGQAFAKIGTVKAGPSLVVEGLDRKTVLDVNVLELKERWKNCL